MALTERQQQVVKLQEEGKSPDEIAEAMGITTNAVYQQLRRISAKGGKRSTSRRRSGGSSSRSRSRTTPARRTTPRPRPTPEADPAHVTPLAAVRARRVEIQDELKASKSVLDERTKAAAQAAMEHARLTAKHHGELASLDKAESALTGKPVVRPAKRKSARKTSAKAKATRGRTKGSATAKASSANGGSPSTPAAATA